MASRPCVGRYSGWFEMHVPPAPKSDSVLDLVVDQAARLAYLPCRTHVFCAQRPCELQSPGHVEVPDAGLAEQFSAEFIPVLPELVNRQGQKILSTISTATYSPGKAMPSDTAASIVPTSLLLRYERRSLTRMCPSRSENMPSSDHAGEVHRLLFLK